MVTELLAEAAVLLPITITPSLVVPNALEYAPTTILRSPLLEVAHVPIKITSELVVLSRDSYPIAMLRQLLEVVEELASHPIAMLWGPYDETEYPFARYPIAIDPHPD